MEPNLIVTLVVGLFGSGFTATLLSTVLKRKFEKEDRNDEILAEIKKLNKKDVEMEACYRECLKGISKVTLAVLIEHNPKDHKSILDEAVYYFGELGGDSWAYDKVSAWAESEGINIDYIKSLHARNINVLVEGGKNL